MATYYIDPTNGNDADDGLSWANAFLTLNGCEDEPVVAGDLVYVGPGVYREKLTVDVSGAGGNEIVYIGDVTGEHTDGVGGIVRITGSDNDQTAARDHCIEAANKDYRIFRGFLLDTVSNRLMDLDTGCKNWTIEDLACYPSTIYGIAFDDDQANNTIRRCIFFSAYSPYAISFTDNVTQDDTNQLVENCIFVCRGLRSDRVGGIIIRNCLFLSSNFGVRIGVALAGGQTVTVENCIFSGCSTAVGATGLGELVEDFNTFHRNNTDRTNVAVGGNSQTYPPLFLPPILHAGASQASGFQFPWWFGKLSEWSQVQAITGSNEPTEDLWGIARPVTASKNSWGPLQFHDMERETGTVRTGSASLVLHDAGRHQIWVPVTNTSTTISVYVYREANYAGSLPQMICKQPGQADDITTDVGAASQWNLLTTTFVPAANPPYVVVELISRNTNGANDKVFFDDLVVN